MRRGFPALGASVAIAVGLTACADPAPPPDLSLPAGPVMALLDAARTGDLRYLAGLCDPVGEVDSDARRVCTAGGARSDDLDMVEEWFEDAAILGDPRVTGDRAEIALRFGPEQDRETKVIVVRRRGQWYLGSL